VCFEDCDEGMWEGETERLLLYVFLISSCRGLYDISHAKFFIVPLIVSESTISSYFVRDHTGICTEILECKFKRLSEFFAFAYFLLLFVCDSARNILVRV
jgi:hypothetical protein